jgi:hypothetical protein
MTDAGLKAIAMAVSYESWVRFDLAGNIVLSEHLIAMFEKGNEFAGNWMKFIHICTDYPKIFPMH